MSIWDALAAATADLSILPSEHRDLNPNIPSDEAVPFTVGMISLAAKMAKTDGVVTKDEVLAFKKAFNVSDAEMKHPPKPSIAPSMTQLATRPALKIS